MRCYTESSTTCGPSPNKSRSFFGPAAPPFPVVTNEDRDELLTILWSYRALLLQQQVDTRPAQIVRDLEIDAIDRQVRKIVEEAERPNSC